jgi:acyl transferase domain-containing protein
MGQELYERDAIFRQSMDACDGVHVRLTGKSIVAELYNDARKYAELADIRISHPALFSVGYSLTQVLLDRKIQPDCVLGYSLGEYIAATVAGALALEDAMAIVVQQARLLSERTAGGGMLTVLSSIDHFECNPSLYAGSTLASVNYEENFVVSGSYETLAGIKMRLDDLAVVSLLLPVQHGFHSPSVDPIEAEFRQFVERVPTQAPRLPMYSAARVGATEQPDGQYFWDVIRKKVDFRGLVERMNREGDFRFVDLGPTGTLSTFIKYGFGGRVPHATCMNQVGKNVQTLSKLVAELSA